MGSTRHGAAQKKKKQKKKLGNNSVMVFPVSRGHRRRPFSHSRLRHEAENNFSKKKLGKNPVKLSKTQEN